MVSFWRTSNFARFFQLQIHTIHLTKTVTTLPLQLHVKSQSGYFFSFPLKHLNEFIIAHRACYEIHLLYPPWFGYANKTNQRLKMYNFTIHTVLCFSFSFLSWHRQHNVRCVSEACYCLTQFATYMSRLGCRQFTTLQHDIVNAYLQR